MILMMLDIYANDRYSRGKRGFNDRFWTKIVYLICSQSDPLATDFDDDGYLNRTQIPL